MKVNKAVLIGLLGGMSIVAGIAENFIPMPIPAIRLGLSNVPAMIMLYISSVRAAFAVMMIKIMLLPVFSGNILFKFSLGCPSGLSAFLAMCITFKLFKNKISAISVGVAGAFAHMIVQLAVASSLYIKGLFPSSITGILLIVATGTGILTGILTNSIIKRIESVSAAKHMS